MQDRTRSKGAGRLVLLAGVLAAMIVGLVLMEEIGSKPRPAQTSDSPAERQ
jgi:hypothetical protein